MTELSHPDAMRTLTRLLATAEALTDQVNQ